MATNILQNSSEKMKDDEKPWYHLVWLDKNMKMFGNQIKIKSLKEIDPEIETFLSGEECIDSIQKQNDQKLISHIIFIISGALSKKIIPKIQDYTSIFAIFIFCTNADDYANLKYQKLRAIHTDIDELMDGIEKCITKFNETTDFSIFLGQTNSAPASSSEDNSKVQCSIRNLNEDLASFLWFRQMHEFMLTLNNDDDEKAKEEMIINCFKQCEKQSKMKLKINEFRDESLNDNKEKAIRWYTDNSFVHRCTNTVLRKENISQVYSYRYIIKLICQQLKILHKKLIDDYKQRGKKRLRVYRGQYLKSDQIELLKNNIDNLISLNGFVSTTKSSDMAKDFIQNCWQEDFQPVLFKIDLDMTSEHSVPFADVTELSKYPEEEEILLAIGSVFNVKSVELEDVDDQLRLHIIHLTLKQTNQLTVTKYIEQTYSKHVDSTDQSVLFGKLLFDMGECRAALKYFLDALNHLEDYNNHLRPIYLNNIGVCYAEMNEKDEALKYYKMAVQIYTQTKNKRGLSACQHNIASMYYAKGDQQQAHTWASRALETRQNNNIQKASTLDLIGCIYLAKSDFDAALQNFEDALKLRLAHLSKIDPNHPDIGVSHHNLGKAKSKIAQFKDAQTHYVKAAEIYRHNYSQTHSLVIEITKCLKPNQ